MNFTDEDWDHMMALFEAAPERYNARVLEEATAMINDDGVEAGVRLSNLRRLLGVHQKRAEDAFNPDKSSSMEYLVALAQLDLLTVADLVGFSPGARATVVSMCEVMRTPLEIVTHVPDADEEVPPPRMLEVRGREVEVRVLIGLADERSESRGRAPCHVGLEVEYRGEAKIVEVVKFDSIPSWGKIAFEVESWIDRHDPWSWEEDAAH